MTNAHGAHGAVRVEWLDLDCSRDELDHLASSLAPDERDRVARYATTELRDRATVRLARRREVIGELLDVRARDVVFAHSAHGAPIVLAEDGREIGLSSSHCGSVGLVVVAIGRRVGCDVEARTEVPDPERLIARIASAREARALVAVRPALRARACLEAWTRKEAIVKATGLGLTGGLSHVEVPLGPLPWGSRTHPGDGDGGWWWFELDCEDDELAAVVVAEAAPTDEVAPQVSISRR